MALIASFKLFVVLQVLALTLSSPTVVADQPHDLISRPKAVVVQGSVYCKSCKYIGNETLEGATPLEGAVVELTCSKNQQNPIRQKAVTAKNGIFLLKKPKQLNLDDFRSCKASLLSSSIHSSCNNPTDLNFGLSGSSLTLMHRITTLRKQLNYEIFTIKSFAFEPTAEKPCDDREPYETDEVICNPACVLINYGCYC